MCRTSSAVTQPSPQLLIYVVGEDVRKSDSYLCAGCSAVCATKSRGRRTAIGRTRSPTRRIKVRTLLVGRTRGRLFSDTMPTPSRFRFLTLLPRLMRMIPLIHTPELPPTFAAATGSSVFLPSCDAATFIEPLSRALPDIQIRALDATALLGLPVPASSLPPTARGTPPATVDVCLLTVNYTHLGEGDAVTTWVGLPLLVSNSSSSSSGVDGGDSAPWNGRFLMNGGGGWLAGSTDGVVSAVASGYASSATDAGHEGGGSDGWPDTWGLLKDDGGSGDDYRVNWPALEDFASRALVEAVGIGKRATEVYFGEGPRYSYWNGCSTGGRQGHGE